MLARLKNAFIPSTTPSALLVIGKFGYKIHILHLIPEDGTIERFGLITPPSITTFHQGGAREQAREQIGVVTLHVGDGETPTSFFDDVEARIRKLQNDSVSSSQTQLQTGCVEVPQLVQDVLKPAALDAVREREERDRSMNATQTYPVFIVYILRSRAGKILTEPTSFPQ